MQHANLAFVHTSPVHIQTFENVLKHIAPQIERVHFVYERWLAQAVGGISESLISDMAAQFSLVGQQADLTVCTCSTLGGAAEQLSSHDRPIQRIDRAMAEQAVCYDKVGVLACLEATIEPTQALLWDAAKQHKQHPDIQMCLVPGAWPLFLEGHHERYGQVIREAVHQLEKQVDVIVLAQASMATALPAIQFAIPILASPETGVVHALKTLDLI